MQLLFALLTFVMVIARRAHVGPLVLLGLWVAGLIQLIYHLSKSPDALRAEALTGARGFETLVPPPPPPMPGQRM